MRFYFCIDRDVEKAHGFDLRIGSFRIEIQWRSYEPTWGGYDPWMLYVTFVFGNRIKMISLKDPKEVGYDQRNILGLR